MPGEYSPFAENYVSLATGNDARQVLEDSVEPIRQFLFSLPEEKAGFSYAPGKWTIRQLLQHMIDTERVFSYRAMCISRGEEQSLPGFDENIYAENAKAENRDLKGLAEEFVLLRQSSSLLFRNMSDGNMLRFGTASNHRVNANAIAFILVGHALHHQAILTDRYL